MPTKNSGSLIDKINCYLQIAANDPHSTTLIPLAEAFRQIGLLEDALSAARLGVEALPNFSPGFATLGRVLAQMGNLDEAQVAYDQALSIDRQNLAALVGLVRLHLIRGERERARQVLQRAIEFHPEDEMVANLLLALDLPRPWAAPAPAPMAVPAEPPVAAVFDEDEAPASAPIPTATLAEIYVRQGLNDQAVKVYEEILRLDPGNVTILSRLEALRSPLETADQPPARDDLVTSMPVAPGPEPSIPREPLAVFEAWLEGISLRRAHVR